MLQDNPAEAEKFVKNTLANLSFTVDLAGAVKKSDLVVEAIVEKMPVKHDLFSKIDSVSILSHLYWNV